MADGAAGYAMAKSDDLISSMNQRLIITRHVENFDKQIRQLESERAALITGSGTAAETTAAAVSQQLRIHSNAACRRTRGR
jgi:cystathionine beta-lyase/cystathionine gamma-synthase